MPNNSELADRCEQRAKDVMSARWSSDLTIAQVAQECSMSPAEFERAFCETAGVPPRRYLAQIRVREAKGLLLQSHLLLTDVAIVCGFKSRKHFSRIFKWWTGNSPTEWQRINRPEGQQAIATASARTISKPESCGSISAMPVQGDARNSSVEARN